MNIYDNPEKFACKIIGEVDAGGGCEYDKFVVWVKLGKRGFGWSTDSGCSCSSAFYDSGIPDLTWGSAKSCHAALHAWEKDHSDRLEYSSLPGALADLHYRVASTSLNSP